MMTSSTEKSTTLAVDDTPENLDVVMFRNSAHVHATSLEFNDKKNQVSSQARAREHLDGRTRYDIALKKPILQCRIVGGFSPAVVRAARMPRS
jgi:hypothetical protein